MIPEKKAPEILVLIFAASFPTLAAWVYFVLFSGESWMLTLGALSKLVQFALPAVWIWLVLRQPRRIGGVSTRDLLSGALSGLVILAACLGLYYGYIKHHPAFSASPQALGEKLKGLGADTPGGFLVVALFYSLIHSFLEEYYWRWFVTVEHGIIWGLPGRTCSRAWPSWPTMWLSSTPSCRGSISGA